MAKYFYVYSNGANRIVKMYNTDFIVNGQKDTYIGEKEVDEENLKGFCDGIKASGYVANKELADADINEQRAKVELAKKMTEYHAARDAYSEAADILKKVKAKYGI